MIFRPAAVLALAILGAAGCQGLSLPARPSATTAPAWTASGGTAQRANATTDTLAPPLHLDWTYNAEAGFGPASALVAGDFVLVGTRKGELHGIRLDTGKRQGFVGLGSSLEGASALAADAFFGASADGKRPVFRYDLRAGRVAWRRPSAPVVGGVLLDGPRLYAADAEGRVHALDAATGDSVWTFRPDTPATFRAAPVLTDAGVVVADSRGRVRLFDAATGAPRWAVALPGAVYATPAAGDGAVFVATTRGALAALDAATGATRWQFALPDTTVRLTAPALDGSALAIGATDGRVRLFDARTGALVWETRLDGALTAPPLLTPAFVYVGTMMRQLVALRRADGGVAWEYTLRGRVKSALAVAGGGLVVLSEPRFVYRFSPEQRHAE